MAPVTPIFEEAAFDPETTRAMGVAYAKLCAELGVAKCADPLNTRIAEAIIQVARTAERDPDRLCADAAHLLSGNGVELPKTKNGLDDIN